MEAFVIAVVVAFCVSMIARTVDRNSGTIAILRRQVAILDNRIRKLERESL